jgi:hypothetical protein
MIKELVELNGSEDAVACPECAEIVKPCPKCSGSFLPGQAAFCAEDDYGNHHHYHEDCLQDKPGDEDEDDEEVDE